MASASTSASMISYSRRYDVFLSFRGEDTRDTFTDHLYAALVRGGLRTFRDNDNIDRGQELKPEIERAIMESRASVVVLSEKYANSGWCLDELLLILEQKRSFNHFVLPIFYHVDPSDVRNQRETFVIEVEDGVEGSKWTEYNVNRWKAALTEVANLTGMVVSGPEAVFIAKVADTINRKLDLKRVSTPAHLIGMDTRARAINSWLENEQSGANVLAICGMGGSGKTTLAQVIYNANKENFGGSSYLEEIGKTCKEPAGLLQLQKKLLTDIPGGAIASISSVSEGTAKIEDALQRERVLIVLDDIDELEQLGALLGTRASHTQSKIIITTRLLDIRAWFGPISWRCEVQKPELLNHHESLHLLCYHAFGSKTPMDGFMELSVQLAEYCAGSPLALKVLGSSLFVDAEGPHERSSMIETWTSFLNSLSPLKGDLDDRIQCILQKSFDSLPRVSYKELFLHIAFFFVGDYEDHVAKILEHDWQAKAGITTLINRCLLTVSPSNKLMMHQLLQEMARTVVLKESKDPAKRSRVSQRDETYRLLEKGEGSETIEGLALDMYRLNGSSIREHAFYKLGWPSALKTASLARMGKLKLLKLVDVKLTGSYKKFPELRWLYWMGCLLEKLPSGLMGSNLVSFHMRFGDLIKFEPPMVLHSLKFLHLTDCWQLVSVHKLSRLPNLEILDLSCCSSLTYVCEDIEGLQNLVVFNLRGCDKLFKVPLSKKFIYQLQRLKALYMGGEMPEQSLFSIPKSVKDLDLQFCHLHNNRDIPILFRDRTTLFYMSLGGNAFDVMPNNINLKGLQVLNMTGCPYLKYLLCLPNTLEQLYTDSCVLLEKITFESGKFRLQHFGYQDCTNLLEIQGLFKLVPVEKLDEADLGPMKWIKAYQDLEVDLVGDEITKGRIRPLQVLYEYGIMSTYLQAETFHLMSSSPFYTFCVPSCHKNRSIQGLYVTCSYKSFCTYEETLVLFTKISNTTKGLTWMYHPVVYCQPGVGNDAAWISYWPIGNILDTGDEINVSIIVGDGLIVSGCSASLVFMDDDEVELEYYKNFTKEEEVIGGDLSEFEVSTGVYYLCRRDFFKSTTPDWLGMLLDDTDPCKELQGWRKSLQGWRKSRLTRTISGSLMGEDYHRHVKVKLFIYLCFGIGRKATYTTVTRNLTIRRLVPKRPLAINLPL